MRQLRNDTDSLVCNCNQPDCPFQESHSLDIQHIECNFEFRPSSPRHRKKGIAIAHPLNFRESPSLKAIDRRGDGTIVERDGPRTSRDDSLEKRLMKLYAYNSYNCSVGKHLSVSSVSSCQDCLVDSDNVFGTSSDDDSAFSRFEPKRRQLRRKNSRSASNTSRTSQTKKLRTTSLGSNQPLSRYQRNIVSLPSCAAAHLKESLSASSSSSSLSTSTMSRVSTAAQ